MFRKMGNNCTIICMVVLVVFLSFVYGCGNQIEGDSEKITAEVLGDSMIVGLRNITGELSLKSLVTVTAHGKGLKFSEIDRAYVFETSPDMRSIAYAADDGIYVIGTDGSDKRKITDMNPKLDLNSDQKRIIGKVMAWSPDGKRIAFVSGGNLYSKNVYDKSEPAKLVAKRTQDRITISESSPALAPRIDGIICPGWIDNSTLVYQDFFMEFDGQADYHFNIIKIKEDGSEKQVIIQQGREPLLSPDRTKILYHIANDRGGEVRIADTDGANSVMASDLLGTEREPMIYSWSRDGSHIIFDGFAIDAASGQRTIFSGQPYSNDISATGAALPAYSPDGRWVLFPGDGAPGLVKAENGNFVYDLSGAFSSLRGITAISWIKG
ncbi:TolB family protein [Phosphitispora sp. TUW77]|uniref:TolB family protein n=1 Tax=Phosphitispora sp. TUW77 TaxID=3152361 RepID=UPI003AB3C21B